MLTHIERTAAPMVTGFFSRGDWAPPDIVSGEVGWVGTGTVTSADARQTQPGRAAVEGHDLCPGGPAAGDAGLGR